MKNNCIHCGFCTPKNQVQYHFTRNRLLNNKRLKTLGRLIKEYKELLEKNPTLHPYNLSEKQNNFN